MNNKIAYKYLLVSCYFFSFMFCCLGQSFSVDLVDDSNIEAYLISNDNDNCLYFTSATSLNSIFIHKLDSLGNRLWSNEFKGIRANKNSLFTKHKSNKHVFTRSKDICFTRNFMEDDYTKFIVTRITDQGEILWAKVFSYTKPKTTAHSTLIRLDTEKIRVLSSFKTLSGKNLIEVIDLNEDGSIYDTQSFKDEYLPNSRIHDCKLSNSNLAFIKNINDEPKSIVDIYDSSLGFINGVSIEANVMDIVFNNDKYYLLGNDSPYEIISFIDNDRISSPVLLCFDVEFNLLWSRKIDFPAKWFQSSFEVLGDNILMKLRGAVEYRNIEFLITVNADGELESTQRFTSHDTFSALRHIGIMGQDIAMVVQEDTIHESKRKMIRLGKNFDGLGCYLDYYCLDIEDVDITFEENKNSILRTNLSRIDSFSFQNEIKFLGFQKSEDSCVENFPAFPAPIFDHPDTICVGIPLVFENLQNTGADSVQWSILGSNTEQSNQLNPSGIVYLGEGYYNIVQTVYQNGCANSYESSIAVLKSVSNISDDTISLCRDSTILLDVEIEDAISYLWDDGSNSPEKLISTPGSRTVEINNESCSQIINFIVEPFDYSLIVNNLGEDTIICSEIPFLLQPTLHEDGTFIWSDGEERLERYIEQTGFYELTTSLNGCSTKSEIFVEVDNCSTQVYIPNSFSPNDDGVNDIFQPLGDDFEIVDFKVFDRWGNLVHDSIAPWTGDTLNRGYCPQGIYIFLLKTRNDRLNIDQPFKGNVTLLR